MNIINYGIIFIIINYLILLVVSKLSNNINYISQFSSKIVRQYSLLISVMILYIVLIWWYLYELNNQLQWVSNLITNNLNIIGSNVILGFDSISLYYCLLIGIIILISILSGWYMKSNQSNLYIILVLLIGILLLINFLTLELLSFYVLFESTLILLFILVGVYGSANKEKAAYYILLYTLFGSLFMLLSICMTTYLLKSTNYYVYNGLIISIDLQMILWLGLFIAILIKSLLFLLHIWLLVVHSESLLAGSIILASLVLKLTIYLILRWMLLILSESTLIYTLLVYLICLLTIILVSLITIVQIDLKVIIAYSSISQLGSLKNIFCNFIFLTQQTICRKFKDLIRSSYLGTNIVSNKFIKLLYHNMFNYNIYSILNRTSSVLVKILNNYLNNPQIIKYNIIYKYILYFKVNISEAICLLFNIIYLNYINSSLYFIDNRENYNLIKNLSSLLLNKIYSRSYSLNNKQKEIATKKFNEWLAGLIDGDGNLKLTNDLVSLIITFDLKDHRTAELLKQRLGGKINLIGNKNTVKYKLHSKEQIIKLIDRINGNIRTLKRIEQLKKVCNIYDILFIELIKLEYNNGWLSGLLDSDGSISFNKINKTIGITIVQKDSTILNLLANVYGGKVFSHNKSRNNFKFVIENKDNLIEIYDNYFKFYLSRTLKINRIVLIKRFYELKELKAYKGLEGSILYKAWIDFIKKWNKKATVNKDDIFLY